MQAMLCVGGGVINITNVLLIGPGGHLDAANFFAAPAKRPPPKKAAVAVVDASCCRSAEQKVSNLPWLFYVWSARVYIV